LCDLQAIHARKHHIQQNQVEILRGGEFQGGPAIAGVAYLIRFFPETPGHLRFIFDDKDVHSAFPVFDSILRSVTVSLMGRYKPKWPRRFSPTQVELGRRKKVNRFCTTWGAAGFESQNSR